MPRSAASREPLDSVGFAAFLLAALFGGLWPMLHSMAPSATFAQYAALAAPPSGPPGRP
ncbi:MAG: hypothetical protein KGJ84_17830 [Elusimicrobia bacterium]|nr:hypothetical protein [Elusimicrobiota bacterium]